MIGTSRVVSIQRGRNAGQHMAMLSLQDRTTSMDAVMFSDHYARDGHMIGTDSVVFIEGHLDINNRSGERQFIVERVLAPSDAARCLTDRIELYVPMQEGESSKAAQERIRMTAGYIKQAGGSRIADGGHAASIFLHLDLPDRQVTLKSGLRVVPHEQLLQQLTEMLGGCDQVKLIGTIPHAAEKPSYKSRKS
jgi:DNA polymerase III alpha subunit